MIALRSDHRHFGVFERILDHISNVCSSRYNFLKVILPYNVGGVVAGPDQDIWLDHFCDVLEHFFKSFRRRVTFV